MSRLLSAYICNVRFPLKPTMGMPVIECAKKGRTVQRRAEWIANKLSELQQLTAQLSLNVCLFSVPLVGGRAGPQCSNSQVRSKEIGTMQSLGCIHQSSIHGRLHSLQVRTLVFVDACELSIYLSESFRFEQYKMLELYETMLWFYKVNSICG